MRSAQRRMIPHQYQGGAAARRRSRRSWQRSRRWPTISALAVVILAGVVLALSVETAELLAESEWFKLQGVDVGGLDRLSVHEVHAWLGVAAGERLLDLEPDGLATGLEAHPRIATARVKRGLDRRLHVEVEERQPIALVLAGVLVEVDRHGIVLPPLEGVALPDLPVLSGLTDLPLVPGERLAGSSLERAVSVIEQLAERQPALLDRLAEIDLSEDPVLLLRLTDVDSVLRTHAESLTPEQLDGLQNVLADLERRGRHQVEIDLRFEGQLVVRPAPGATGP